MKCDKNRKMMFLCASKRQRMLLQCFIRNFFAVGGVGGGLPSYGFPRPQLQVFPFNCQINPHDPYIYKLLEPQVNVPYCLR